jgi:predicted RNase H-like HicB family nuclease
VLKRALRKVLRMNRMVEKYQPSMKTIIIEDRDPRPAREVRRCVDYSHIASDANLGLGYFVLPFSPLKVKIDRLYRKELKMSLDVIIEPDGEGFLARTPDLPLYGYGDDREQAVAMLKREIESLHRDLLEDNNFTEEWLSIRRFLDAAISE